MYQSMYPRNDGSGRSVVRSSSSSAQARNLGEAEARHGRPRGAQPRPDRLVGGEATPQSGPLRVHVAEEMTPRSNSQVHVAAVAHSGRAKVVQVAKANKPHSNRLVGAEATAQPGRPRLRDSEVANPQISLLAGFVASSPSAEPEPQPRSGRLRVRNPEVTTPHSDRLVGVASSSTQAEPQRLEGDYYDAVADVFDEYHEHSNKRFVDVPIPELPRGQAAPTLESTLPRRPVSDDYTDTYRAVIYSGFLDSPTSSSPEVKRETHSSEAQSPFPPTHAHPRNDSTFSYVQNDYGILSTNTGSTLRVVNNPPAPSVVSPSLINISNRNSQPFPSFDSPAEAAAHFDAYDRGEYPRRYNRASLMTVNTVFGDGARSVHQLYRTPYTPMLLWLRGMFVEPVEEIMARVNSIERVKSLRKTVRIVRGKPPKEEGFVVRR